MIGLKGIAKRAVFVLDGRGVVRYREVLEDARNEPGLPEGVRRGCCAGVSRLLRARGFRADAVHVVGLAAFHFNLNRGVRDAEAVLDGLDHRPKHLLSFSHALLGHENMAAAGHHAGPHHPDVQIVYVEPPGTARIAAITAGISVPAGVPSSSTVAASFRTS